MTDRYSVYRPGSANKFGDFGVVDERLGYQQPIAICKDGEVAQRIVDLLNGDDATGGQLRDASLSLSKPLGSRLE